MCVWALGPLGCGFSAASRTATLEPRREALPRAPPASQRVYFAFQEFSRPLIGGLYIDIYIDPPHRFIRVNAGGAGGGGAAGRGRDASGEGVGRRAAPGARRSSYPTLETSRLPWFLHPRRIKAPWENSSPRPFGFTLYQVEPLFNGG